MLLKGHAINNSGRGRHIFKQNMAPGGKVTLEALYELYKKQYTGDFSLAFVKWLEATKLQNNNDIDIVLTEVSEEEDSVEEDTSVKQELNTLSVEEDLSKILPNNLTAKQLSELKIKDNPRKVIKSIMSVHKLRRAQTFCKGRAGKETLVRLIRDRINELAASGYGASADTE